MAKLGYIEFRPGSVPERSSGHALFEQSDIPERAKVQRELKEAQSAILASVVSVRREDAEVLRLSTKQNWERFLCASWGNHVEAMGGVIERENVRWVATFHVNQENNLHCHVESTPISLTTFTPPSSGYLPQANWPSRTPLG